MSLLPWFFIAGGLIALFAMHRWLASKRVRQVVRARTADSAPNLPHGRKKAAQRRNSAPAIHLAMRVLVSLIVLLSSIFIILRTGSSDAEQKWAFGAVGTILGYWLKA
ncbi:hypothetical protein [Oleiagrimonas soli]|uniref:Putative membrane protein n=1 Tax=Oleiagrimonas soli TaxID=1543381 RepID=A0A841KEI4_9GAMM|nr:hypothetical protein [Oleiagrimonas soli]MBB6183586.1 putative membrane protein [Oleiagrimonas soli]